MKRAFLLVLIVAGCNFRINGGSAGDGGADDGAQGDDGAPGDGDTTDGPTDAMPTDGTLTSTCELAWLNHTITFDTPTAITPVNSTSYDRDPFVSADELTLWFSNGGAQSQGGGDIFVSTRATRAQPWGTPQRDSRFSTSGGAESKMSMTASTLYAVVGSNQTGGAGGTDIWETDRPNTSATWKSLDRAHTSGLATAASELDSFVTPDGLHLYYAPTSPSPQHIVVAKRTALTDPFSSTVDVAGINDGSANFDPMLFANDRVIVFASDRAAASGGDNIWYATRATTSAAFGTPILLPGVNSGLDDGDPHVGADGCHIYFARNVGGGVDWELFSATATP